MDAPEGSQEARNPSWFSDDEGAGGARPAPEIDAPTLGWIFGLIIFLSYAIGFLFYEAPSRRDASWIEIICVPVFGATEVVLLLGLIVCVGLAVKMYCETNRFWTASDDLASCRMSMFNELAKRHKHLSQLWFTIALAIFLGGLIYAAFHVMEGSCRKGFWDALETDANSGHVKASMGKDPAVTGGSAWAEVVKHILPNIFLYSIFFVGWGWTLRNYRAHWHNFVTNEHRHASLRAIDRIREGASKEVGEQLELQAAIVVMVPTESAYLEGEGDKEVTAGERLLKLEEAIRGLVANGTTKPGKA